MSKELKALELIKLDYGVEPQGYELIKSALEEKDKLENVVEILKNKDIEMNLLKGTFKFENTIGYSYYLKVWCMNSLMTFDDRKFITQEEYDLLKEVFGK